MKAGFLNVIRLRRSEMLWENQVKKTKSTKNIKIYALFASVKKSTFVV